jgi:SulP family sulfate permease
MNALKRFIPMLRWLSNYDRADFRPDLIAGLTTAVMLVPQAMAYAVLAGLPPEQGLYAATVPLIVYALFGSSRQLAVGPVAVVSLLVLTSVSALAEPGSGEYIALATLLAFMVGAIQLAMGLFKMGFVVNFLSHPVISGFTSGAAIIIGLSQLKDLIGIDLPRGVSVFELLGLVGSQVSQTHVATAIVGGSSIAALVALKRWAPKLPRALVVVGGASIAAWAFDLESHGVALFSTVPGGLPPFALPDLDVGKITALGAAALTIATIAFMESVAVARSIAAKHGDEVSSNQELIGLGAANLAGSLFGGYPTTGGFARSAVNDQAGARTQLAAIVTAGSVLLVLLFLTPLFESLPKAVLAAIIMVAVSRLVDFAELKHLWRIKRADSALLGITLVSTLVFGPVVGIAVGVSASILWFTTTRTRPFVAELGRRRGSRVYRNVERGHTQRWDNLLILRFDASFYFGNVAFLRDTILARLANSTARRVILDLSGVNAIDASGVSGLERLLTDFERSDAQLSLARIKMPVDEVLRRSGIADQLGPTAYFDTVHEAVVSALGYDPAERVAARVVSNEAP